MKALILEEPGKAVIGTVPEPVRKHGEVLLKVRRVGLCGSDLNSFRGRNPMISYPRIPGHEVAATIVELDDGHPGLKIGMDVTLSPYTSCGQCASCRRGRNNACQFNQTLGVQRDGALTEYICVSAERLYPAKLDLKSLCIVEPLTVGFHAVARGRVEQGESVAVLGCGGVGLGAVAAAAFRGATTIAVDVDDAKLAIAQRAGATHGLHAQRINLQEELHTLTSGRGPDVIIEAIGTPDTFRLAVEEVAFTGRVVYIGYAKEPVAYETKSFVQKELDIFGARNAQPDDFRSVIQMLEAGRFPVDAAVSNIVSLGGAPGILAQWSENPSRFTKIMIDLDACASGD
jgi:2-desacetyl-2-hydroxyethyl bacteriochlorophyllide A dehydrogenase